MNKKTDEDIETVIPAFNESTEMEEMNPCEKTCKGNYENLKKILSKFLRA